jgi:hypothetical protein
MTNIQTHIEKIAKEIGSRESTSNEEKQAANYIANYLESLNLTEVLIQPFKSIWTWTWPNVLTISLVLIGILIYPIFSLISVILLGLAIFFFYSENDNRPTISRIFPKLPSQNVIGKIKPQGERLRTIILIAHMDSSRADNAHHPSRVKNFRTLVILNFILYCIVFGLLLLSLILDFLIINLPLDILWYLSLLLAIPIVYTLVLAVTRQLLYELVPGANDNASGVAVVLELMNLISRNPLQNTEVISVLTGCEESGCGGMLEFLKQYGGQYREAFYLNFDNIGAGNPIFTPKEGIFLGHHANEDLLKFARLVQKENPNLKLEEKEFRSGYTDGTVAMVQGHKVLTFLALNEYGVPPHWHWETDTIENLEEDVIDNVKDFGMKLIKMIDEDFVKV